MMAVTVGTVLAGRYELLEPVGQGGMATVFRARRLTDGAVVAVKVLHEHHAHDREFVERFQREARAASQLRHPNIVPVLESGSDRGVHFIVMEFVEGTDLKTLLRRRGRLREEEVVRIAVEVCKALAYAHARGIVHRDIKPQNILITPEGAVKVTDFGIARAATSATITEAGTVLGSVHYLAPEQALGNPVGPGADLYALGVVLYELLTGRLPFEGESPIAIALRHVHDLPPPPRSVNPEISPRLEGIVLRSLAKSPLHRYRSAEELSADLEGRSDAWRELPTVVIHARNAPPAPPPGRRGRRRGIPPVGVAALLLLAAVGATLAAWRVVNAYFTVAEVTVPDLRGKPLGEAQEILAGAGLRLEVLRRDYHDRYPVDTVVDQMPPPGMRVREGRVVQVVVSQGPELVQVPDVTNRPLAEARILLAQARLRLGTVQEAYHDRFPSGVVIAQEPAAHAQVPRASVVHLVVSKGPEPVQVPDLAGLTLDEARAQLAPLGLSLGRVRYAPRADAPPGTVVEQDPPPGATVRRGSGIAVLIATAPPPTPEPSPAPLPSPSPPIPSPAPAEPTPPPAPETTPEPGGNTSTTELAVEPGRGGRCDGYGSWYTCLRGIPRRCASWR
ncbi:MAG: PASTA domain-containing protein [Armatimonadetes bacterium]|nr:PASTA domain-containing protein [Armatimonadota bacterium]MDW8153093.1 PASTA domain-containing protein [Armatimonadota bacterium]